MAISHERLQEFMRLYEAEFGESIDEDEAREVAHRLVELYQMLSEPLPDEVAQGQGKQHSGQTGSAPQ